MRLLLLAPSLPASAEDTPASAVVTPVADLRISSSPHRAPERSSISRPRWSWRWERSSNGSCWCRRPSEMRSAFPPWRLATRAPAPTACHPRGRTPSAHIAGEPQAASPHGRRDLRLSDPAVEQQAARPSTSLAHRSCTAVSAPASAPCLVPRASERHERRHPSVGIATVLDRQAFAPRAEPLPSTLIPSTGEPMPTPHASFPMPAAPREPRRVRSADLLGGGRTLLIEHEDKVYRLALTKSGKLILTR
jgi:hemin uptake protein HemP